MTTKKKSAPKAKTAGKTAAKGKKQTSKLLNESRKAVAADIAEMEKQESQPKTKRAAKEPIPKKLSALDAAAQVLASAKEPLNCPQLIEAMTTQGLWTSPGGKTPHATLYSAIVREINVKGKEARFTKTERGHFTSTTK
jgi:hypothetical protein